MNTIQTLCVVGVDSHADTLAASGTDAAGVELFYLEVPNTDNGIDLLLKRVEGSNPRWGIEGTGTYGRLLCDRLLAAECDVVEVPTRLTARHRSRAGNRKTDKGDAVAIARAVLLDDCAKVSHLEVVETLRILSNQRKSLVTTQTEITNRVYARLRELGQSELKGRLRSVKAFTKLAAIAADDEQNTHHQVVCQSIRIDASNWLTLHYQVNELDRTIKIHMPAAGIALQQIQGIGPVGAARIIGDTGDIRRFPTEGHYASYCGTAPVDASSGRQQRHRLNRWGARLINSVIHTAVITQIAQKGFAHDYVNNRISQGKTKREAIRAAKRKLTKKIYHTLKQHPLT